jgi:hypothetical protein
MTLAGVDPSQLLIVIEDAKHAIDPLATPPFAARPDVTAKPPHQARVEFANPAWPTSLT